MAVVKRLHKEIVFPTTRKDTCKPIWNCSNGIHQRFSPESCWWTANRTNCTRLKSRQCDKNFCQQPQTVQFCRSLIVDYIYSWGFTSECQRAQPCVPGSGPLVWATRTPEVCAAPEQQLPRPVKGTVDSTAAGTDWNRKGEITVWFGQFWFPVGREVERPKRCNALWACKKEGICCVNSKTRVASLRHPKDVIWNQFWN